MSFRRPKWQAAIAVTFLFLLSCGQVYRPVVIPLNITPPNPANFHEVFGLNVNVPFTQGTAMQIDVAGDTDIGAANMGVNPTHAAILPNNSRVFVTSAGSGQCPPAADVVTSFSPATDSGVATGLGNPLTFSYPNSGTAQSSSITNLSEAGNTVTVTLNSPVNNAAVGTPVEISGVPGAASSAYNGCFAITAVVNGTTLQYSNTIAGLNPATGGTAAVPSYCPYLPDFVNASQTNAVFVANYGTAQGLNCGLPNGFTGTDSIFLLSTTTNTITNSVYLGSGTHPVAMVETPDAQNLYVLNQGRNNVTDLAPVDFSPVCPPPSSAPCPIPVGNRPAWAAQRVDGQRIYVVTEGDGNLVTIRTDTNAIVSTQSVGGPGANFVLYDKSRNRVYVTNPVAGAVYVFDATTDPPTPLGSATGAIPIAAPTVASTGTNCAAYTCTYSSVMPVSITALPDGSRFYVASYVLGTATCDPANPQDTCNLTSPLPPPTCPDQTVIAPGCMIPQVTVYNAATFTVKTTIFPLLPPVTSPASTPFALTPATFCAPVFPQPYTTTSARFRMFAVAAADSSHVYSSLCDGGSVAIINATTSTIATGGNNTPDILVTDLVTPFSAGPPGSNGQPPPQTPVFLLVGQ